jgi:hypothetical protein
MTSYPPPGYQPAPEGAGTPGQHGPGTGRGLDPLSQTLLKVVAGLAVLLIVLVGIAIKYDSGEADLNPIAEAAQRTAAMAGAKTAMTATYSTAGKSFTFTAQGDGEVNWKTGREQMTLTFPIPNHEFSIEAISGSTTVYMRSSAFDGQLPPGKEWLAVKPFLGHEPDKALVGSADAQQLLQSLEASGGSVEELGDETIRGTATTRYRSTVEVDDLERKLRSQGDTDVSKLVEEAYANAASSIPVEVWIGDDGLVRRLREVMPAPGGEDGSKLKMDIQVDFYEFGIEPDISPPAPSKVFDATPLVKAKLGASSTRDDSRPASSAPSASGAPLSRADFETSVTGLCSELSQEAKRLKQAEEASLQAWKNAIQSKGLKSQATLDAGREVVHDVYEPIVAIADRAYDRLSAITPPRSMASEYNQYLRIGATQIEVLRVEMRALEIGDYSTIQRKSRRSDSLKKSAKRLARRLGISSCDSGN